MKTLLLGLVAMASAGMVHADTSAPLKVGDAAPDFSLPYATRDSVAGDALTLSSFSGKSNVVVAFYPADWSGGCTREVCTLRDNFASLGAVNADVVGISGDYVYSHHEWAKFHDLPFRLAADHDHAVAKRYGSYNDQTGHDRRTVFLVDKQGKIAYVDMAYSTRDSVSFEKLQAAVHALK